MISPFRLVEEMHRKFVLPVRGLTCFLPGDLRHHADVPDRYLIRMIDDATFLYRLQFMMEELTEIADAHRAGDVAKVARELADLVYVAVGTAHFYGIPFDEVFAEVHRANMDRVRATGADDPRSKRGTGLDVVKPDGWRPPDVEGVLARFGLQSPRGQVQSSSS